MNHQFALFYSSTLRYAQLCLLLPSDKGTQDPDGQDERYERCVQAHCGSHGASKTALESSSLCAKVLPTVYECTRYTELAESLSSPKIKAQRRQMP
jgi:hypothetical protein